MVCSCTRALSSGYNRYKKRLDGGTVVILTGSELMKPKVRSGGSKVSRSIIDRLWTTCIRADRIGAAKLGVEIDQISINVWWWCSACMFRRQDYQSSDRAQLCDDHDDDCEQDPSKLVMMFQNVATTCFCLIAWYEQNWEDGKRIVKWNRTIEPFCASETSFESVTPMMTIVEMQPFVDEKHLRTMSQFELLSAHKEYTQTTTHQVFWELPQPLPHLCPRSLARSFPRALWALPLLLWVLFSCSCAFWIISSTLHGHRHRDDLNVSLDWYPRCATLLNAWDWSSVGSHVVSICV